MPNVSKSSKELKTFFIRKRCGCHALLNVVPPTAAVACTQIHASLVARSCISSDALLSHFFFLYSCVSSSKYTLILFLAGICGDSALHFSSATCGQLVCQELKTTTPMSNNNIFSCLFIVFAVLLCHSSADFSHVPHCNELRRHVYYWLSVSGN